MKIRCYSVFDAKAEAFITPWFMPTDGQAIRTFSDCVRDERHEFGKHPEDYALFRVGEFDSITARWTECEPQKQVECLLVGKQVESKK